MTFFTNKFFWFGIFSLLILIGIPITVYFVKQQQDLITKAKPTSVIAFEPATKVASLNQEFDADIFLTPNENAVTFVQLKLLFDPTKIEVVKLTPNAQSFPLILENPKIATGSATLTLGIGAQPLSAITTRTNVATVTIKPIALTAGSTPTRLSFDPSETQILSLADIDEPSENVLNQSVPLDITITQIGAQQTPFPQTSITPTSTGGFTNAPPTCTQLLVTPSALGAPPFSVTLSATGTDSDGLISKATFNFGDGQTQDVSEEDNIDTTITSEALHTYQTIGTYIASATFTDDEGGIGTSCTQTITVTDTITPTQTATPTSAFSPTPTLAQAGSVETTIGIVGAIIITVIGGILLFTL